MTWRRALGRALPWTSCVGVGLLLAACGVSGSEEDPLDDVTAGRNRPAPGGGPSSGGVFNSSTSSSSGRSGSSSSSSSSGGSGSSGGTGSSSSSSGDAPSCEDPSDAPDFGVNLFAPVNATGIPFTVDGVLDGEFDVDFYGYDITGSATTELSLDEAVDAELCIFMKCKAGTLTLQCRDGSVSATNAGLPGCCATGNAASAARLTTYMYCAPSVPDDSFATVRVSSRADQCSDYTLRVKL